MPRRQGIRGGSTRADGTLVRGAADAFGPTASVGAGVAKGFQSTFMDTFKYVRAEKDKDYTKVEEEFYKTFDQVEALQKDYNVLNIDQQNIVLPWLKGKKQELYEIKRRMHNAPRNERDALRLQMNEILSTVQGSAASMEGMADYFNKLSVSAKDGKLSDANGIIDPEKAKNTLNFAFGKSYNFDQKSGSFIYNDEIYQKADETANAFFTETVKAYELGKAKGVNLTDDEINLKKKFYKNSLNENDVVSLLFDDFDFNTGGYYNATIDLDLDKITDETVKTELLQKQKNYKENLEMLQKGRGTDEYNKAINFFKDEVSQELVDGYKDMADKGFKEYKTPDVIGEITTQEVKEVGDPILDDNEYYYKKSPAFTVLKDGKIESFKNTNVNVFKKDKEAQSILLQDLKRFAGITLGKDRGVEYSFDFKKRITDSVDYPNKDSTGFPIRLKEEIKLFSEDLIDKNNDGIGDTVQTIENEIEIFSMEQLKRFMSAKAKDARLNITADTYKKEQDIILQP